MNIPYENYRQLQLDLINQCKSGEELESNFNNFSISLRNKFLLPKIVHHINIGNAFIAIENAHLFGENGVIELLKNNGFIITR